MLPGANAVISVAEKTVPSGLAALLVASIPLWVDAPAPRLAASASPARSLGRRAGRLRRRRAARAPRGRGDDHRPAGLRLRRVHVGASAPSPPRASRSRATRWSRPPGSRCSAASVIVVRRPGRRRGRRRRLRRVLRPLDLRPDLPDHLRLAAGVHVLRVAAAERPDLEGLHVRVREPGRGDRAGLADPRRGHLGRPRWSARRSSSPQSRWSSAPKRPRTRRSGNPRPAMSIGPISSSPSRAMTACDGRLRGHRPGEDLLDARSANAGVDRRPAPPRWRSPGPSGRARGTTSPRRTARPSRDSLLHARPRGRSAPRRSHDVPRAEAHARPSGRSPCAGAAR